MKFLTTIVLFATALVMATANQAEIDKALVKGTSILAKVAKETEQISREHHGHLLKVVAYHEELVKTWLGVLENKSLIPMVWSEDQQKIIEAALSHTEDRVMEEVSIVKNYIHKADHFTGNVKDLIAHVNKMLVKGHTALEQLKNQHHRSEWAQIGDLTTVIHMLGNANNQLEHKHEGTDARKEIETVECMQESLNKILHRLGHSEFFY